MVRRRALVCEPDAAIERRLEMVVSKPRLELEAVDRAVAGIRQPEALRDRIGDAIRYSQRVEAEVAGLSIETLLPYTTDDYDGRFLETWVPDERGHGHALDILLKHLDLPAEIPRKASTVPIHNRLAGLLGKRSTHAYQIVSMLYHSIGAMNERLALGAYTEMGVIASELGEDDLATVLFGHLRRDEAAHLGYYRTYARRLRANLAPWQLALTRAIIVHTYAPVGAGDRRDKALCGRALAALEDDPDNPSAAALLQTIADELLARPGQTLPPFVAKSLRKCVDSARDEGAPGVELRARRFTKRLRVARPLATLPMTANSGHSPAS